MLRGSSDRSTIAPSVVVDRLEAILPGLGRYAMARATEIDALRQAIVQRVHPGRGRFGAPVTPESAMFDVDHVVEYAQSLRARVERIDGERLGEIVDEDVLFVSDDLTCEWVGRSRVAEILANPIDGDALIVHVGAPRVIVVHHEGAVFDVQAVNRPETATAPGSA